MAVTREEELRLIELRRSKVLELLSIGVNNQSVIARTLNISEPTVSRDIKQINIDSKEFVNSFLKERLPLEIHKALTSFDSTIRTASITAQNTHDENTKLRALETVNRTWTAKLDLISNFDVMNYQINKPKDTVTAQEDVTDTEEQQEESEHPLMEEDTPVQEVEEE